MSVEPEYPIKPRCDVTADEEWRPGPVSRWRRHDEDAILADDHRWVEVRPKQRPDPKWITDDRDGWWPDDIIVTTVGEMRDRTDLDQWEYADTVEPQSWESWNLASWQSPDDFPVIVRRKK